jgi:putative FmdB family regulatory protein
MFSFVDIIRREQYLSKEIMPTYEHLCGSCKKEFTDVYSIKENPPTKCQLCGVDGFVKRLVSGGSGMGIVKLSGRDLVNHAKAEGLKLQREAARDENVAANLIGESRYHENSIASDRAVSDIINVL